MEFSEVSQALSRVEGTSSRLEMADILSELLASTPSEELKPLVYLLTGRLVPEFVPLEFGLSAKLLEEALFEATRLPRDEVAASTTPAQQNTDHGEAISRSAWAGSAAPDRPAGWSLAPCRLPSPRSPRGG